MAVLCVRLGEAEAVHQQRGARCATVREGGKDVTDVCGTNVDWMVFCEGHGARRVGDVR